MCLIISFVSCGCIGILGLILNEGISDDTGAFFGETVVPGDENADGPNDVPGDGPMNEHDTQAVDDIEVSAEGDLPELYVLDMSSAEAFIADLSETYDVVLLDATDYLSGPDGYMLMQELNHTFSLFSPPFFRALVAEYREYDSAFSLILGEENSTEFGLTNWDGDLTITLYYSRDPDENGVTAAVLAHELAHAVHFIIEEHIGETRSMFGMRRFNYVYDYVEDDFEDLWDPDVHGFYFAYSYGMYDYYEDIATVIEMLVGHPGDMLERLSDKQHEALLLKTAYVRDIIYSHISDECFAVFAPLYEAEEYWSLHAA